MREDGGDVRPGQEICRPDMRDVPELGRSRWRALLCGWVFEPVGASEKGKTERRLDGGKADRPDQKQARPLREKEPW